MDNRELLIAAIAQMIAPRLFVLSGDIPDEMGFPFADDETSFNERVERQFSPVAFWTKKATEIATAVVDVLYPSGGEPEATDELISRSAKFAEKWQPAAPGA